MQFFLFFSFITYQNRFNEFMTASEEGSAFLEDYYETIEPMNW